MPAAAAAWKPAKPDRMDEAQRSQSNLDRPPLRAEGPGLVGTALYGAVRRDAKQVAVPTPSAEPLRDPWLAGHPSVSHGDPIMPCLSLLRRPNTAINPPISKLTVDGSGIAPARIEVFGVDS